MEFPDNCFLVESNPVVSFLGLLALLDNPELLIKATDREFCKVWSGGATGGISPLWLGKCPKTIGTIPWLLLWFDKMEGNVSFGG